MKPSRQLAIMLAVTVLALCLAPLAMAQSAGAPTLATVSNDAGGVRIVVKPKSVAAEAAWEFEVTMDTHIKPLDDDLTKTTVLVDDSGRRYLPQTWQGDPAGGHHRKGILRFPAPTEQFKSFELQIQRASEANKRVFQWTMK